MANIFLTIMLKYLSRRVLIFLVFASILPGIAFAAGAISFHIAQIQAIEAAEQLGGKNLAYWFLALAGIAIASWTWILKWLLEQLESQRAANGATTDRLIGFMEKDHAEMRLLLGKTTEIMERLSTMLPQPGAR